jgi:hypothetical protein
MPLELDPAYAAFRPVRRETPTEGMKRIERNLRSDDFEYRDRPRTQPGSLGSNAGRSLEGYNASIGAQGPLSAGLIGAGDPETGKPQMVGGRVQAGPLSYQYTQPTFKGAPAGQQVGVSVPFDADSYFGVSAQQTPGQGRTYGANVGGDGWNVSGGYNPTSKSVNANVGYQANFADGGPAYEPAPVEEAVQLGEARPLTIRRGPAPISLAPRPETGEDYEAFVERQALNQLAKRKAALEAEAARPRSLIEDVGAKISEYTMPRASDYTKVMEDLTRASSELTQSGREGMLSGSPGEMVLGAGKSALGTALPVIAPIGAAFEAGLLKPAERTFGPAARHAADVITNITPGPGTLATGTKILAGVAPVVKATKAGNVARAADDVAKLAADAPKIEEAAAITKDFEPAAVPEAKAQQPITGGNEDLQFTNLEREARVDPVKPIRLKKDEREAIRALAQESKVDLKKAEKAFLEKKKAYPESEGWEPFEVAGFERGSDKKVLFDDDGLPVLKVKQGAYEFHGPKGNMPTEATNWDPTHIDNMADKLVKEVTAVADKADAGEKNAKVIMASRNWYRAMRDRLRQEYGGFADTMADVLGTTSAQTGVRQNWDNTIEVLSQFSRGAYDRALGKLDDFIKAGGEMGSAGTTNGSGYINRHLDELRSRMPEALKQAEAEGIKDPKKAEKRAKEIAFQETQQGDFPLITKADGKTLFNANSPQTMLAMLDKFRERKAGDAPKTPNFTGNLIGYSDKATIDVWAARLLRRLSGRNRMIPEAESGVGGGVLAEPLPSGIGVGGEFGFGQEVFKKAAEKLKQDPRFEGLGDDDLQAIAWFLEKEQWGKKGWTSKAGEGGSLELEANFAGVNDRDALKELRRLAETDPTFAERAGIKKYLDDLKVQGEVTRSNEFYEENKWLLDMTPAKRRDLIMQTEGLDKEEATRVANEVVKLVKSGKDPEKEYARKAGRLETLTQRSQETSSGARQKLEEIKAISRRFVGGLSPHREVTPATSEMFREGTGVIEDALRQDPSVIMSKATTSRGRYIDPQGNIWDEPAYDLEFVTRNTFDPQPVFTDMVAQAKKRDQDSVFLSEAVPVGTVEGANPGIEVYFSKKVDDATAEKLTKIINELEVDAGFTFVTDYKAKNRAAAGENVGEYVGIRLQYIPEFGGGVEGISTAQDKMLNAINQITSFDGVSSARYVEYDTQVLFRDQYDGYLAGNLPEGRKAQWTGQRGGEGDQAADRIGGVEQRAVGGAVLHSQLPKRQGYAEGGTVNPVSNVHHQAIEQGLSTRDLSLLIKAATGAPAQWAHGLAGHLLSGDDKFLRAHAAKYPKIAEVIGKIDAMLSGDKVPESANIDHKPVAEAARANRNPNVKKALGALMQRN